MTLLMLFGGCGDRRTGVGASAQNASLSRGLILTFVLATYLIAPAIVAKTIYVNANQTKSPPDGLLLSAAFASVHSVIDRARYCVELWIVAATYSSYLALSIRLSRQF